MYTRFNELLDRRWVLFALAMVVAPFVGCGGGVDMEQPAEIDPIMQEEAELSDQYMMEQEAAAAQ